MMRKGMCTAALCALLMSGAAVAVEERDAAAPEPAPAKPAEAMPAAGGEASGGSATDADAGGGAFARMPPGADSLPAPAAPPLAEEGTLPVPEGSGTHRESPVEDRAADEAPGPAPEGAQPAPGENAGSRI
jgi:nicotinate-nucleotide--dimethylbenzimidazole phosphoribosyltransferase